MLVHETVRFKRSFKYTINVEVFNLCNKQNKTAQ